MRIQLTTLTAILLLLFSGCEYDNFDAPKSILSGRVVHEGMSVGVRTNGTQLELWQSGFQLYEKIPVYIAHDGSFSAALFDGQYKLVRLDGAPWEKQSDTIIVDVKGNTTIDVPVTPYFIAKGETYSKSGNSIKTAFEVVRISETAKIDRVRIYLGKSILTDQNRHEAVVDVDLSKYNSNQDKYEMTQTIDIPAILQEYPYVFARIGVSSSKSNEFYYTQVAKIDL